MNDNFDYGPNALTNAIITAFTAEAMRQLYRLLPAVTIALAAVACGDNDDQSADVADTGEVDAADASGDTTAVDATDDAEPDIGVDVAPDGDTPDVADAAEDADDDVAEDAGEDTSEPLPELVTQAPFTAPADPLAGTDVESCALYQETRCVGGELQRCNIYDTAEASFVAEPDPLLERAYLFDRWRDRYTTPSGQAIDRDFVGAVLPGTPEEEWGSDEQFKCYCGTGDGGIWTGWATVAAVLRYTQTGTEADYQRFEQQTRDMLTMYDVTGVPGYMSRNHFLLVPDEAPLTDNIIQRFEGTYVENHHRRVVENPETIDNLPVEYTEGIEDSEGEVWFGTPMWTGRPSIDQNTGPMTALPMAYGLLRDEDLKDRIEYHLTCYLKRLQRVEFINLQSNEDLLNTLISYFSAGELLLDEGDLDLTEIDRIVGYVQIQINSENEDTYDRSCPDTVQVEPYRVIDAADPRFIVSILDFIKDMDTNDERPETFDHYYFPSIRGGDAMHLMHLATMAYHFTGEEQYREFLFRELIGEINTLGVVHVAGAFQLPAFCRSYFGDQITYGPWWAFLQLLGDSELRTSLQEAFHAELWAKHLHETGNVDLAIMYAGGIPEDIAEGRDDAIALIDALLPLMGGNGGALMNDPFGADWLTDPKRTYTRTPAQVFEYAGEDVEARCPTDLEVAACTAEIAYAGVPLPGLASGTYECQGAERECAVGEENQCMTWRTNEALPPPLRGSTDFLWQRDPYAIGESYGTEGYRQYSGTDFSEPYWNARRYGFVTEGAGQVLAWEGTESCQ